MKGVIIIISSALNATRIPPVEKIFFIVAIMHLTIYGTSAIACDLRKQLVEAKLAPMIFSCCASGPQFKKAWLALKLHQIKHHQQFFLQWVTLPVYIYHI